MASRLDLATAIAADQGGLITAAQCASLGFSAGAVDRLVKGGRWRPVFRGVYFTWPTLMPDRQRIRAALLSCGPAAVAILASAGILYRWPVLPDDPTVQVSLPAAGRRLDQPGLTARQLVLAEEDVTAVDGLAVTTPARTAADLLLRLPFEDGVAMLDAALNAGLLSPEHLDAASALVFGRRGAIQARESLAAADGRAQSPLETRVRLICRDDGLTPEELQFRVRDARGVLVAIADLAWPSRGVLVEADGRDVRSRPEALLHDRRRQNQLIALGFILVRFTWADTLHPRYVVQAVRQALAVGGRISR
ncbi:type IV toxin-antitoxin system AbiEi family antitoxin domain-containing protein [Phytohabitans rumicis]|uniref:AbiEi antitoxin N-terminal domain-containing protein n=1 Tax=Phytohabitans rumicis TaxID=1076125 RepID=A0A6V8L5D4_9ACTN|nr:type IV toxin-antitoxin system AbiEi family antitoxin domain-containing protein [Phytohabitans rumicis]GFJ90770.1 hypothetical protein Prum_044120 [Phytohabitans rumicis]